MKMLLLLALTLLTVQNFAFAQRLPWPEGGLCAKVRGLDPDDKFREPITALAFMGSTFKEIEEYIAILQGKPSVKISFEYVQYRFGYQVIANAEYSSDCQTFEEDTEEIRTLKEKSDKGTLSSKDFKGPRWIHAVQAIDTEEVNCLAISKTNGVLRGCNDLWQDGITEDEAVCIKGQTHLKCHVECIETIYNRVVEKTPGFCPEEV